MENEEKKEISRRDFMKVTIGAIGGLITLGFGIPAISYVVAPALAKSQVQQWIQLGAVSKIELGKPTLFKVTHHASNRLDRKPGRTFHLRSDRRRS